MPAILDALTARCGSREDADQGGSRTPDAGTGPEIHTLRATAGPGTAPGSFGPWDTAQPRRRSWAPWRAAPADGRAPPREAAAPRTPAPARRSTRCGPRWALAPPRRLRPLDHGPALPAILDALAARTQLAGGHRPGRQPHHGTPAPARRSTRCGPRRAPAPPPAASGPGTRPNLAGDPGRPGGPHQPAGGHRPGRQPHHGRRHRPGDPHAAAHGGPWHRLRQLRALEHGQTPPEILGPLAARTSWQEGTAQGDSRTTDAGTGPEIHTLRATAGHGTAPQLRALDHGQPSRRSWTPWRPAAARGRIPAREAAAPWTPPPARRSTHCRPRRAPWHRLRRLWTLGHGQPSPEILDALAARTSRREDASQGSSRATDAGTGPEIHALRGHGGPWHRPRQIRALGHGPTSPAILDALAGAAGQRWAPAISPAALGLGTRPDLAGDPGRPGGPHQPAGGHRPGKQPRPGRRHRPGDPHAAAHGGPWHRLRQLRPWNTPTSPAILDALAARCGPREDTAQGGKPRPGRRHRPGDPHAAATAGPGTAPGSSGPWTRPPLAGDPGRPWRPAGVHGRTPAREAAAPRTPATARRSTRCGPRRAPGTASGGSGPWNTARPRRRSWAPWRAAPADGRTPARATARTPDAATGRRSTRCGPRWALAPPPAAPGLGTRPVPSGGPGPPDRQHRRQEVTAQGDQPHPGRRHRAEIYTLRAHGGPWHRLRRLRAPDYGQTSPEILDALAGPHQPAGGRRPGKQPRPGRRHRRGDLHAAAHGGPWHRLRRLRPRTTAIPRRRSWTPCGPLRLAGGHHSGGSRALDAGTGPEIHMLRATVGPGTASVSSGPWDTARPRRRSWTPWRPATACGRTPLRGQPRPGHRHRPGDLRAAATVGPGTASGGSGPWDMAQPRRRSWAPWRAAPAGGRTQASTRTPPQRDSRAVSESDT